MKEFANLVSTSTVAEIVGQPAAFYRAAPMGIDRNTNRVGIPVSTGLSQWTTAAIHSG
jgi:hypothetical protein